MQRRVEETLRKHRTLLTVEARRIKVVAASTLRKQEGTRQQQQPQQPGMPQQQPQQPGMPQQQPPLPRFGQQQGGQEPGWQQRAGQQKQQEQEGQTESEAPQAGNIEGESAATSRVKAAKERRQTAAAPQAGNVESKFAATLKDKSAKESRQAAPADEWQFTAEDNLKLNRVVQRWLGVLVLNALVKWRHKTDTHALTQKRDDDLLKRRNDLLCHKVHTSSCLVSTNAICIVIS